MGARKIRDIEYYLLDGSDRKTTDIVIERDGSICVRPPLHMSPEEVDNIVEDKRMWIYKNLSEWQELNAAKVVREWVNGESYLYLGRNYRLSLTSEQEATLQLKNGRFYLCRSCQAEDAKSAFIAFYIEKGLERIKKRVEYFAKKVGVTPKRIDVKELGFKWASCSQNGDLNFHWKCMMAPLSIIDYIIVHELCHLHHRDHSVAFWNEVDKVLPDYLERKEWLRVNGVSLDF